MVSQNKDNQLHISSTISVIHNFRMCFNFHFVTDCKNDYNFNCHHFLVLSLIHSLHLIQTKQTDKLMLSVSEKLSGVFFEGLIVQLQMLFQIM